MWKTPLQLFIRSAQTEKKTKQNISYYLVYRGIIYILKVNEYIACLCKKLFILDSTPNTYIFETLHEFH